MAEIAYICDIVGCDAETARRWLKVKNNDSAAVVNAWLDGTQLSDLEAANTWDDSAFTSVDREGNLDYNANLRPLGYSAAPTRGNSPVPSLKQPTSKAEEDADLERAFALSRGDDPYQGQETGTIGSNGQTLSSLRPASGGYYDPANWAMVPSSRSADTHQANEVIPDPDPEDRKYKVGNPRFLKPLASGMAVYLPGFLTIVRSIPLAREALLARGFTRPDYGFNDEWWKGHEIKMPKIVHIDESFTPAEPAVTEHEEVLAEMQRLMSFLDASHRAYGSADSLASTGTSPSTNTPHQPLTVYWQPGRLPWRRLVASQDWGRSFIPWSAQATKPAANLICGVCQSR
ncbi:hypothetical protein H2203_003770 [Taxawa tesnikishii (nom. ined.)]|nr:hypothetical protein H2203_003770 [Dothideales sp. JES 119]